MSYNPQFTEISSVAALSGETIDDTSDPTAAQVLQWIEEVEMEMVERGFSTNALAGVIMDVPEGPVSGSMYTVGNMTQIVKNPSRFGGGLTVTLPNVPFISVDNVQRNIRGYKQDTVWEDLTEGPGTGSDFLIVKRQFRAGLRGVSLFFYNNVPQSGYQRLKLDYVWGFDLPEKVLREYATDRVAVMFLFSKYLRKEPLFDINVAGFRSQLNPFTDVHQTILDRIEEIEYDWLPSRHIGAALMP